MAAIVPKQKKSVRLVLPGVGVREPGCNSPASASARSFRSPASGGGSSPHGCDLDLCATAAAAPWRPRRPRANAFSELADFEDRFHSAWEQCEQPGTAPTLLGRGSLRYAETTSKEGGAELKSMVAHERQTCDEDDEQPNIEECSTSDTLTSVGGVCMDSSSDLEVYGSQAVMTI